MDDLRLTFLTLGVADLDRSRRFYEALGLRDSGRGGEAIVLLRMGAIVLALYDRADLARDAGVEDDGAGFDGVAFARNLASTAAVDAMTERARAAGATVRKVPQKTFWGGYHAYVADPDGHVWEFAWNPALPVATDGSVRLESSSRGASKSE